MNLEGLRGEIYGADIAAHVAGERDFRSRARFAIWIDRTFQGDDVTDPQVRFSRRLVVDADLRARCAVFDAVDKDAAETGDASRGGDGAGHRCT